MSKISANKLLRVASHLKLYDAEMSMTRLQVLLCVYMAGREGALVKQIVKSTGHNQSTIARTLSNMGKKPLRGQKDGLEWVETHPDIEDPRRIRCYLTPQGKTVVAELDRLMQ
jgi:DNA-binding MarR family transcriptional regulator